MNSERRDGIGVGDTVMVARWSHQCVNPKMPVGRPFVVGAILAGSGLCRKCDSRYAEDGIPSAIPSHWSRGSIPLAWLIKLLPPQDSETLTRDSEVTA